MRALDYLTTEHCAVPLVLELVSQWGLAEAYETPVISSATAKIIIFICLSPISCRTAILPFGGGAS